MANTIKEQRCHICRGTVEAKYGLYHKPTCERCMELLRAPPCRACGEPVRQAQIGDPDPYHDQCRRCSSCVQVVSKEDVVHLAGRVLCKSCDHLFGRFFMPGRRNEAEKMKDAFAAWDQDGSGAIEKRELRRVLKALNPDFADRDLERLMDVIDSDGSGAIEYKEFCEWIMQDTPLNPGEDSFEEFVRSLMQEAGTAAHQAKLNVAEVHLRSDGLVFVMSSGAEHKQSSSITTDDVQLTILDPEEFLCRIESVEDGLIITKNTGHCVRMRCHKSSLFGPWQAPEGFHIVGLRTKPTENSPDDHVVGVNLGPLAQAKHYDKAAALRFAAQHEFLFTLQRLLSKAQIDVNSFGSGGVTALMAAAQNGNVASLRMLLGSKAKPNLTDLEGWTALTYGSRYGHSAAVDVLLDKGAVQDGDSGGALREALRHQHNSAARALLRAGFGPAPRGTFALEDSGKSAALKLDEPTVNPAPGAFSKPVTVELTYMKKVKKRRSRRHEEEEEEEEKAAGEADGGDDGEKAEEDQQEEEEEEVVVEVEDPQVQILYTLDGRDPLTAGKRYRRPLLLAGTRNRLRAVAVRGSTHSAVADFVYVVSHYVMADEVVSGRFVVRTFIEGQELLEASLAAVLGESPGRVTATEIEPVPASGGVWLRVPISCPRPHHSLHIDRSFSTVRGAMKKPFLEKLTWDIEKAVSEAPDKVEVLPESAAMKTEHKAGSIQVEFILSREAAEEIKRQLADPTSFLMTKAKLRPMYEECMIQVMDPLGTRLSDVTLHNSFTQCLGDKVSIDEIIGIGIGDTGNNGVLALAVTSQDANKLKKKNKLPTAIKELMPDTEMDSIRDGPLKAVYEYTIDVLNSQLRDGGTVMRSINNSDFTTRLMFELSKRNLPIEISVKEKASARELSRLQFRLEWSFPVRAASSAAPTPSGGRVRDFLDGICMIYNGSYLAQVIDWKSAAQNTQVYDGDQSRESSEFCRAINRAVSHSGDVMSESGGQHQMELDLNALPLQVTDIFFVLAAYESENLSQYNNVAVEIHDPVSGRKLTGYSLQNAGKTQAIVMCSFTRDPDHKKWLVHGLGIKTAGNVKNYDPIRKTIANRQAMYLRWERRSNLIKLRALYKCSRMTKGSHCHFAQFLWHVLDMPTSLFQLVITWL